MMVRQLSIAFADRESFEREYQQNLSNGVIFIPTQEHFEPREVVQVAIELPFCERSETIQAEVVTQIDPDIGVAGARPGVALQFVLPAEELRLRLADLAGIDPHEPQPVQWPGRGGAARTTERTRASLAARIEAGSACQNGRTRDLSSTGALVATDGAPLDLGEEVSVSLIHPSDGQQLTLQGRIARHIESAGRVVAMGIDFAIPSAAPDLRRSLENLRAAAYAHLLGGVHGQLSALGFAGLLQLFASGSSPSTLIVESGREEGRVIFESGGVRHAAIGPVAGTKALARMMAWEHGEFFYMTGIDASEPASPGIPISGAILEAVSEADELSRVNPAAPAPSAGVFRKPGDSLPGDLDKLEATLLELASRGTTVGQLLDAAPEPDSEIYRSLLALRERLLVEIR